MGTVHAGPGRGSCPPSRTGRDHRPADQPDPRADRDTARARHRTRGAPSRPRPAARRISPHRPDRVSPPPAPGSPHPPASLKRHRPAHARHRRPAARHQMTRGPQREPEEFMTEPVTLINAFEVPATNADAFVAAWQEVRDYLRSQPGYIDTVLHQSITPDAEFQFVNVARWQTAEDFLAATQSP